MYKEKQGSLILTEEALLSVGMSLMRNYQNPGQAIRELIDNGVDNRITGKPLAISVAISKNLIRVGNRGGDGLGEEGLANFLKWGLPSASENRIGQYGVGGKAAMGFLGGSIGIRCSLDGSNIEYRFLDPKWEEKVGEKKEHLVPKSETNIKDGYFVVTIEDLKHKNINVEQLVAQLGNTYKPLLESQEIIISVSNGSIRDRKVEPLKIPYRNDLDNFKPEVKILESAYGMRIPVMVGILEEEQAKKPGILKPGGRLYYRGTLIEDGLVLGKPELTTIPQISRLIWEAHLNDLKVTTNKQAYIKDELWDDATARLEHFLKPWLEKLPGLPIENSTQVEQKEKELARKVKRDLEHVLSKTGLITKAMISGESAYRLSSTPGVGIPGETEDKTSGTKPRKANEGQTPPDANANIGSKYKRWGVLHDFDVVPFGTDQKAAEVIIHEGKNLLRINSDYPGYVVRKEYAGDLALKQYIADLAIIEVARIIRKWDSTDEYLEFVYQFQKDVADYYLSLESAKKYK